MRILLVGEFAWHWYQEACADALEKLGCEVHRFGWLERFKRWIPGKSEPEYHSLATRIQYRALAGPLVARINRELVETAERLEPDVVWFYGAQLVFPRTVRTLRSRLPRAVLAQYANDNPFSPRNPASMWRHFIGCIPLMHAHFAYRIQNLADLHAHGAPRPHLLRSYFLPEIDRPIRAEEIDPRFRVDVVFAGHFEDDGRIEMMEAICRAGYSLNLFGGGWNAARPRLAPDSPLHVLYPIAPVVGDEYVQAIGGAKVALCFLSRLNEDTYTRRSFQIPAMRTAMLSERTVDLESLFVDGEEALFFSTTDELLDRLRLLVNDDSLRRRIADGGHARVYRDGHDVVSRMKTFLDAIGAVGR